MEILHLIWMLGAIVVLITLYKNIKAAFEWQRLQERDIPFEIRIEKLKEDLRRQRDEKI